MKLKDIPTVSEFAAVAKRLFAAGWEHTGSMMVDDARKEGVENFGQSYARGTGATRERFWLNYKTIVRSPA